MKDPIVEEIRKDKRRPRSQVPVRLTRDLRRSSEKREDMWSHHRVTTFQTYP